MPRALFAVRLDVPRGERPGALAAWAQRRTRVESEGCHYWVFESRARPGEFLEFIEAPDEATLRTARARAGLAAADDDLYQQVELS